MPETIEPWKVVFTVTDSFNIIECPECYNRCLCGAVIDYPFCPYCGGLRLKDDEED
ncbi:MAG: hypothetical protein J6R18_05785 [Kiritimatiellae bacterium]|nr:hypothetical protein [Kiritimatiellia bacterium]